MQTEKMVLLMGFAKRGAVLLVGLASLGRPLLSLLFFTAFPSKYLSHSLSELSIQSTVDNLLHHIDCCKCKYKRELRSLMIEICIWGTRWV
jgi:hypothetical protein